MSQVYQRYRGLVTASPIANTTMPIADIAVNVRLTTGFERNTDDLWTAKINDVYQSADVIDCTHASSTMPSPRLNPFGTNCGINATANTAAFTLVRFVNKPKRYAGKNDVLAPLSISNLPNSLRSCHSVWSESPIKNATPHHFKILI